jgi:hypothetical protein
MGTLEMERNIDRNGSSKPRAVRNVRTFGDLIDLHDEDMREVGRKRAKQGAGPATLAIDLSFIRTIITHTAAVHGIEVSAEEARLARVALSHLKSGWKEQRA